MGDLFDPNVPQVWRDQVMDAIEACLHRHVFFILTKQPQRIDGDDLPLHPHFWIGVSVDKPRTDDRMEELCYRTHVETKRFVSFEPLLCDMTHAWVDMMEWVIIGQDSRPGQPRPEVAWVQGIIDNADELQIPVFLKPPLVEWWVAEGHGKRRQEFPEVATDG